jgi:hypothetical protein
MLWNNFKGKEFQGRRKRSGIHSFIDNYSMVNSMSTSSFSQAKTQFHSCQQVVRNGLEVAL